MMGDVILASAGGCGRITLNRPKALHALTLSMCRDIVEALRAWAAESRIKAIIVDHSRERGFCAGGDIRLLNESLQGGHHEVLEFFHTEYRMNDLLFCYAKPALCFMDGIVMGGGAGLALPCRYRVATEDTSFAMPETGIGLFPDVGGSWFLSRLPGRIGAWLALTGSRLDGAECHTLGLATHYLPKALLTDVKSQIAKSPNGLEKILVEASITPPPARIEELRGDIDRLFAARRIEDIVAALAADPSAWAKQQLVEISRKAPLSCKVALRLLDESRNLTDFSDNMRMEYRAVSRLIRNPDFSEGVRAFVIDKDNRPNWALTRFTDVPDAMIDAIVAPLPEDREWMPLEGR